MMYAAVTESTGSHISAVHCNGVDALVDAQYVEFPISGDSDDDKNRVINIQVYTDLTDYNRFQLLYDGTVVSESENGSFSLKAKDIPAGHTLKVRVIDSDGRKLAKIDTNIKTYKTTTTGKLADNKFSITFPQDLKIIGGWSFDVDLSSLPFFVIKDEDTIKIGVGASGSSKWSKLNGTEDTTSYWDKDGTMRSLWFDWKQAVKKTKQDIITNMATTVISEKTTDFSSLGCSFVGSELSPLKVDAKAAFYLELKYENGKWSEVGADGFISISASMSWSTFMLVFYVPIEFKVTGKIGASADVSVLYDVNNAKWDFSGTLDITLPSLTGSATIGIPKVFNGGGYVNLTNKIKVTMWNNIKGTLSGDLGVQGQFVIFSGSKSLWQFLDWEYLNKDFGNSSKKSVQKKTIDLSDIGSTDCIFNDSAYSLDTRDYLENQSEWLASGTSDRSIKKAPSLTKTSTPTLLQSSIYQEANPQIISTDDGLTMMVWTADIADRTTGNQTAVVYSVYDDASGNWSAPAMISDDGTADAYPDVATDGENIYVVWVNTNTTFDENVTMEEFAAACEISAAEFDKETGEFGNIQTITNNDKFDFMPAVFADHGEVYVAYTENSDNSPLTMTGSNTVNVMRLAGETIETVSQTVLDKPVESLDVSTISGALTAAVAVDENGDLQTTEDVEIYLIDNTGALTQYTDNEMYERSARFESINGEYALAYYDDSGIHYTYDLENETVISLEDGMKVSADYVFVNDGEGAVLLVRANAEDSGKANLYAGVWDGEAWVGDAQITDCSDDLKSFSACKNADGGIKLVYTTAQYETEITEDNGDGSATGTFTETVDMYATAYERTTDVELIAADFDNNSVAQGEVLPVTLYVKNNGLTTIDGINITSACMGVEQSETVSVELKPGQTDTVEYQLIVPETLSGITDVRFTATTDADANSDNNEQTAQIGYTDLSLTLEKLSSGGLTSAVVTITNNSCIATNAKIRLHKDCYDGEAVIEYTVLDIPAFGEKTFYLNSDSINGNFDYGDAVCVEIAAAKDEYSTGDNFDFFTVDTPDEEEWSYSILDDNKIRIDKYNGNETELVIPATWDDYTVSSLGANVISENVTTITLPSGLESVATNAFDNATSLTDIHVVEDNENFVSTDGILCSIDGTKVIRCPIAHKNKEIVLPDSVREIESYAFANVGLTELTLPDSLEIIRSYAFSDNDISVLTISEGITRIERNSFEKCYNLTVINYNATDAATGITTSFLPSILVPSRAVFYNDSNIETVNISRNVKSLPSGLFAGMSGLKTINIETESELNSVAKYAFYKDPALSDVYYGRFYKYWKNITIETGNTPFTDATLHCLECEECIWDDGEITKEPTCITSGTRLFTCTICEKERTEVESVNPNNHTGETAVINSKTATCTEEGYSGDTICADCKTVLTPGEAIPKTDHAWNSGAVTKDPTCTDNGVMTFTCADCGETKTEPVDALGHDFSDEWTVDSAAECEKDGTESRHCSRCDATTDERSVPAPGHVWDSGVITKAATCREEGVKTFTCTECGAAKTETVGKDANNHTGGTTVKNKKAAACVSAGYTGDTCCKGCGTLLKKGESVPATGHSFGAWTVTKAASCMETGTEQRVCANDASHIETRTIAKTAHTDGDNDGVCDVCGADMTDGGDAQTGVCKYCGKVHTGVFGRIISLFHSILYFFSHLFGKK